MRKIAAHIILDEDFVPRKNAILIVNDALEFLELQQKEGPLGEEARLEFYPGMIIPCGQVLLEPDTQCNRNALRNQILGLQDEGMELPDIIRSLVEDPKNKKGLILVQNLDRENLRLSKESKLRRLI